MIYAVCGPSVMAMACIIPCPKIKMKDISQKYIPYYRETGRFGLSQIHLDIK